MDNDHRISVKEFFDLLSNFSSEALYIVDYTTEFKRNVKLSFKRNLDLNLLKTIIEILAREGALPSIYHSHPLRGYKKKENEVVMECHIQPDWLLIWKQNDNELTLLLTDTGTHADLFGM